MIMKIFSFSITIKGQNSTAKFPKAQRTSLNKTQCVTFCQESSIHSSELVKFKAWSGQKLRNKNSQSSQYYSSARPESIIKEWKTSALCISQRKDTSNVECTNKSIWNRLRYNTYTNYKGPIGNHTADKTMWKIKIWELIMRLNRQGDSPNVDLSQSIVCIAARHRNAKLLLYISPCLITANL